MKDSNISLTELGRALKLYRAEHAAGGVHLTLNDLAQRFELSLLEAIEALAAYERTQN
jgi:hypothetical protein